MHRLSLEDREMLVKLITHTPEDREKIESAVKLNWFGTLVDVDPKYFSTPEGITRQLDKFYLQQGLIYYVDRELQMQRVAVTKRG